MQNERPKLLHPFETLPLAAAAVMVADGRDGSWLGWSSPRLTQAHCEAELGPFAKNTTMVLVAAAVEAMMMSSFVVVVVGGVVE